MISFILFLPSTSSATTDYSGQTGLSCRHCHVEAIGGGPLTKEGEGFLDEMRIKGFYCDSHLEMGLGL
jgi:hypothetical protein